ncbi:DUF5655 domain-containing protein [Ornithinimicrobium cerasi]|nr:DUF5655 domain-containing protein [Ornithinimicrobium cerasi]
MTLAHAVDKALEMMTKLKESKKGNEANTKAFVIEPVLQALGWNLHDIDVVEREVQVFDGTFLDYALSVSGSPKLYVEAKGLNEKLDDKKFIAQTINYANNDGVVWCVLTNGIRYRVFKTNEPVSMEQKLLFEVDLRDDKQPLADRVRQLGNLGRGSVADGGLDSLGERVFTDTRVRAALSQLAVSPPPELMSMLTVRIGHPSVPEEALRRSLNRILDGEEPKVAAGTATPAPPSSTPLVPGPAKAAEYPLDHHLGGKSSLVRELFESVDNLTEALGADVSRRVRKQYIGYFRGKHSFFTLEIQRSRVLVYLALDPSTTAPWQEGVMRDVRKIGHFGMGDLEYSLTEPAQLAEVRQLVQAAYDRKSS